MLVRCFYVLTVGKKFSKILAVPKMFFTSASGVDLSRQAGKSIKFNFPNWRHIRGSIACAVSIGLVSMTQVPADIKA